MNPNCQDIDHTDKGCFWCCEQCNYDTHRCHFCGTPLSHKSYDFDTGRPRRHWLSDCRPDLVEHEPGELCTWASVEDCYAYQDQRTNEWGNEHKHFWKDGPMT